MKRKYLSALLMGTLTMASVSTFTSCKDYDDDISNLQGQIDKLATVDQLSQKVTELQALISSNSSSISTLQSKLEEAKKAAEKAQTTADSKATLDQVKDILADYAKVSYVDDAKKSLNDAIEALKTGDIAKLKEDVKAAQAAADKAKADAETAINEVKTDLADNYVKNATYASEKEAAQAALKTLTDKIKANADAIVELKAVDVVTKADLVAKLGEYATKQQATELQEQLTNLKNNFADEIAKYALKSDLNSLATKDELKKASDAAAAALQTKLNDYLKADVLASLATKDDIRDLQNKEAVQNLIKDAIQALKDGDIKAIGDKANVALQKANKAESTEGLAYVKALAAEGKALEAATAAATADAKAETNKKAITTINGLLGDKFDAKNTVSAAIELINTQLTNDKTGLTALDGRLSSIESLLNQDTPDATSLKTRVDNIENKLKDIIGQYSTMVTDIQLYNFTTAETDFNQNLKFVQATEQANVFPGEGIADAQFKFENGKYFVGEDSLLVRVSPVDAELTTSNVSLLNSQGLELNDLIEVTGTHRYDGLLTSRAAKVNTGLWVVKFKAKDLGDAFKAAAEINVGNSKKAILYSVAVKNTYTTDEAKNRRVTSEYGVTLGTDEAAYADEFTVNGTSINEIHNRYTKCEDGTKTTGVQELVWKDQNKPATTVVTEGNNANAVNRPEKNNDDRHEKEILAVEKGGDIVIDFTKANPSNKDFGVKGFYVTLDEKFALESAPSELNAWNSYSYENVGYKKNGTTYQPAKLFTGNKGTIKIQDLGNVKGDVIGFRVYAVNYDGTLTDPDGRAFYVAVGDAKVDMTIPATTVSLDKNTTSETFVSPKVAVDFSKYDFDADEYDWAVTAEDKDGKKPTTFSVKYFKEDGNVATKLGKDVKSVQFVLDTPIDFIDGETYTVSTTLQKNIAGAKADVVTVTASFTKVMPTEAPIFSYRDGFTKNPEYIIPDKNSYEISTTNKGGSFDFRNILIINNNKEWEGMDLMDAASNGKFKFNVANGTYADKKLAKAETADVSYILNVDNSGETNLVDNKTERTIAANYVYSNISKYYDAKTKSYKTGDYLVASKSTEKIVYCSWMKTFSYDITSKKSGKTEMNTWLKNNTVEWNQTPEMVDGVVRGITLDLDNLTTAIKDVNLLPVAFPEGVTKTKFGEFLTKKVLAIVPDENYGDIYTTDKAGNQINPYFSASISGKVITLKQISQTAIPSSVKEGNIHFTVKDCFGNTMSVVLPFTIKVKSVAAKKH